MPRGAWQIEEGGVPPELQTGSAPQAGGIPGASCPRRASPGARQAPSHPLRVPSTRQSTDCTALAIKDEGRASAPAMPGSHVCATAVSARRGGRRGPGGARLGATGTSLPPTHVAGPGRSCEEGRGQDARGLSRAARCPLAPGRSERVARAHWKWGRRRDGSSALSSRVRARKRAGGRSGVRSRLCG